MSGPRISCLMNHWWYLYSLEMNGGHTLCYFMWVVFAQGEGFGTEAAAEVLGSSSTHGNYQPWDVCRTGFFWCRSVGLRLDFLVLVQWWWYKDCSNILTYTPCDDDKEWILIWVTVLSYSTSAELQWLPWTAGLKSKQKQFILISSLCSLNCAR